LLPNGADDSPAPRPASEHRYRRLFDAAGVSIWEEDFSEVRRFVAALRAQGIADVAAHLRAHPDVATRALPLVKVLDVNEATLRMFEAEERGELIASLERIFLPATLPVFIEQLAAVAEGRRRVTSETRLRTLLNGLRDQFDYIFIDTPPSLGLLTLNSLVAADAVLIPLNCEYFALEGLADLVATLKRVRGALNPGLDIAGVLMTMHDERTNLGQQVARDIRAFFTDRVYTTVIPRNIRLGEAPSHGLPAVLYDVKSRGAEAYVTLAREFLAREAAPAAAPSEQHHG
jgi:chromosome partitioning protein